MSSFELSGPSLSDSCLATEAEVLKKVQLLLAEVDATPIYKEAYRLDVIPEQSSTPCTAEVKVTVSPTAWFETVQRDHPEQIFRAASKWIDKTRSEISRAEHGPSLGDRIWVPGTLAPLAGDPRSCREGRGADHAGDAGPKRKCSSPVEDVSDPLATCKSYIFDALRAEWLASDPDYYLLQSPKARRELILIPKRGYEPQGDRHWTNEDLVSSQSAWQVFLRLALQLSARIEINFGTWEKVQHDNMALQSCHGHVHFYLTAASWRQLLASPPKLTAHKELASKMQAIKVPAPDRRVQDCNELEERAGMAARLKARIQRVGHKRPLSSPESSLESSGGQRGQG